MERIIPVLTKIASYRMESKEPSRGETYFRNWTKYADKNNEERQNIDVVGMSLVIMALESIKVWAEWIPSNPNGSDSVFKKSYLALVDRGVTFPKEMSYYKPKHTERFNKAYKVEFFETEEIGEPSEAENGLDFKAYSKALNQQRSQVMSNNGFRSSS